MHRHRRRTARTAPAAHLHRTRSLSGTCGRIPQRARSLPRARRTVRGSDLLRHQHARSQRHRFRALALRGAAADDRLHDRLLRIRRRGIQARSDRLPAQTLRFRRVQPCRTAGQIALRTHPQPPRTSRRDDGKHLAAAGQPRISLDQDRPHGLAGQIREHHLPGKHGRIRAHPHDRRQDAHRALPAQKHGSGAARRHLHARTPLLHRQPAPHRRLCQGAHLLLDRRK